MKLPNIFEKEVLPLSFSAGRLIFQEGEKRDSMYVVQSGEVELKVDDKTVEIVGTDGFFGEMALIDHAAEGSDREDGLYGGSYQRKELPFYG